MERSVPALRLPVRRATVNTHTHTQTSRDIHLHRLTTRDGKGTRPVLDEEIDQGQRGLV